LVFIANPNNPTGTYVTQKEVDAFLKQVPPHTLVCFDEAYFDFVDAKDFPDILSVIKKGRENVMILRTFSKSYGLAALRIGYGIGTPGLIDYLNKVRQPFNVNQLAQVAATAALGDRTFLMKTKQTIIQGRTFLKKALTQMGISGTPSQANFILMDVKKDANRVFQDLLKKGIIVRSMAAYGLRTYLRVTIGTPVENKMFIKALQEVL